MSKTNALFDIRHGNVCSLCEKRLNWTPTADAQNKPIALTTKRAICAECYKKLKEKYH